MSPAEEGESNSFEITLQQETAGARRRRQKLYPRLAAGEPAEGDPCKKGVVMTVEELLSGPLSHEIASPKKGEPAPGELKQKETAQDEPPINLNKPSATP